MIKSLGRALLAVAAVLVPEATSAQAAQESSESKLAQARETYETEIEGVRNEAREALLKAPVDPLVRMDELDSLLKKGQWPSATPLRALERRRAQVGKALSDAYEECLDSTLKSGDYARARVLRAEMEQWSGLQEHDLAAWIPLPTEPETGGDEESTVYALPIEVAGPYRLEIEGTAEDVDTLVILAPLAGGGRCPVTVRIDQQRFHAMITVSTSGIPAADLGVERVPDLDQVKLEDGDGVEVVATGGKVALEMLRWKSLPIPIATVAVSVPSKEPAEATVKTKPRGGAKEQGDEDLGMLPVGTKISGTRTRSNGAPQNLTGEVVTSADGRLVLRLNDFHVWDFVFERRSKGRFELADMIKKDPRANDLTEVEGSFRLDDRGLSGDYSWKVSGTQKVSGKISLTPDASARKTGKDDQLAFWPVGSKITGLRGADVRVDLEGTVVRSDEERLEIDVFEQWRKDGKTVRPKVLWVYERVGVDPKTGKVTLRNIEQRHVGGRVTRSRVEGDVVIDGKKLRGDYQFDWQVAGEELHKGDRRWSVEMDAAGQKK